MIHEDPASYAPGPTFEYLHGLVPRHGLDDISNVRTPDGRLSPLGDLISDQCPYGITIVGPDGATVRITGSVLSHIERAKNAISPYNPKELVDGSKSEIYRFPRIAVSEALLNAVVHRDYSRGEDIIVTDGHTLLGADDKAGIAEIVQAMCWLRDHDEVKHGDIRMGFNPDEEIGMGAHHFDVGKFGCEWAYTMDGGDLGDLEFENFNAASAKITIKGVSVHPGYAKGKMVNANRLAAEFAMMLPADETPETTEGYEGFYHLLGMETNIENAKLSYIIRDHDRNRFEDRKDFIKECAARMNEKYGEGTVVADVKDQYYNMKEKIDPNMHVIDIVLKAMQDSGVPPKVEPIRGGTDGAQLSFKGLPCPNIFAGGVNFHGPYEFVSVQVMEKAVQVIINICKITAEYND